MMLIVGGEGAGKKTYVMNLGFSREDFTADIAGPEPVLVDLHLVLRNYNNIDAMLLRRLAEKQIVVCNEVGCGVVPMDPDERRWRDRVGETCALLAERAETVVRLCCGMAQIIKGGA